MGTPPRQHGTAAWTSSQIPVLARIMGSAMRRLSADVKWGWPGGHRLPGGRDSWQADLRPGAPCSGWEGDGAASRGHR